LKRESSSIDKKSLKRIFWKNESVVFKLVSQNGKEEFYLEKVEDPSIHKL